MQTIAQFAALAVVTYVTLVGALALFQRRLIFVPDTSQPDPVLAGAPDVRTLQVPTPDGLALLAWYAPPENGAAPVVLYLHGNGGNIGGRSGRMAQLREHGLGVLLLEYRGYGGNPGSPSEAGLLTDARAALAFLGDMGFAPGRVVLWGESLGTGFAVALAAGAEVAAVLLEAPYTSIAGIARKRYPFVPVDLLLRDRFDAFAHIAAVRAPTLVIVAGQDTVVPNAMSEAMFQAVTAPKEYWLAPDAGHNDLWRAGAAGAAATFLRKHNLLP